MFTNSPTNFNEPFWFILLYFLWSNNPRSRFCKIYIIERSKCTGNISKLFWESLRPRSCPITIVPITTNSRISIFKLFLRIPINVWMKKEKVRIKKTNNIRLTIFKTNINRSPMRDTIKYNSKF